MSIEQHLGIAPASSQAAVGHLRFLRQRLQRQQQQRSSGEHTFLSEHTDAHTAVKVQLLDDHHHQDDFTSTDSHVVLHERSFALC
jgi:hypothetical protein